MRRFDFGGPVIVAACLAACNSAPQPTPAAHRSGRYLGIGTYPAGRMWSRMAAVHRAANAAAATADDDEQIIVLVDSNTGEVRQCGNLSGYCIGMNPWTGALAREQTAPVNVTAHAAALAGEQQGAPSLPAGATESADPIPARRH